MSAINLADTLVGSLMMSLQVVLLIYVESSQFSFLEVFGTKDEAL
jgi:hypothetical protein